MDTTNNIRIDLNVTKIQTSRAQMENVYQVTMPDVITVR